MSFHFSGATSKAIKAVNLKGGHTMVGQHFSQLSHLSGRLWAHTPRFALRAASVLALAGVVISGAPRSAEAQGVATQAVTMTTSVVRLPAHMTAAYQLDFTHLYCVSESGEWGSDEPYVLFFVGDLTGGGSAVYRTSVFGDVDTGETRYETRRLWGPRQMPRNNPDNLIVLAQVMEHDDSNTTHIFDALQTGLAWKLALYVAAGHNRNNIANFLMGDMHNIIEDNREIWIGDELFGASRDDLVGWPAWLNITSYDLETAFNFGWTRDLSVGSANEGHGVYRVSFRLTR